LTKNRAGVVRTPALFFSIIYPKRVSYAKLRPLSSRALDRPHNFPPLTGAVTLITDVIQRQPEKSEKIGVQSVGFTHALHPNFLPS
jgi:hypothetical protein